MNLSASTDGKAIKIGATSSPGTLLHTATSSSTPGAGGIWDEIWLWAYCANAQDMILSIEFGGATSPDNRIVEVHMPKAGVYPIVSGLILQNSTTVKAFSAGTNAFMISGFVNRITN